MIARARELQTGAMLAMATWLVRAVACVLIGIVTFAITPTSGADLVFEIVAYLIGVAGVGYWLITDLPRLSVPRSAQLWMPGMAVIGAVAGVASAAPNGRALVGFVFIAVLAAGADPSPLAGWLITAGAVLALEVGALTFTVDTAGVVGYPLLLIVAFISGRNRRAYRVQAEQAAEMLAQMELLRSEQRNVAVLDERTRIAREIHDVLAHSLGALGIQIQTVRAVLSDHGDTERAMELLAQAQRMATDGLVETRRAVQALRGDTARLDQQIATLTETHRVLHPASIDFSIDGQPASLPADATVALIRTAQEALVNTAKHAPRQPVQILLSYQDDQVALDISNPLSQGDLTHDEEGLLSSVNGGYGLTGMRERLLLIRGTLTAGAVDGNWIVSARVPR